MELARLFVGLPLPESYQEALSGLLRELKPAVPGKCSWTKPGNWHVTLKFLGDVPMEILPDVSAALSCVSFKPITFKAGGGGYFPSAERPRVLWAGAAEGGAACSALASDVEAAMAQVGFAPEERPFSVHLTLARVKSSRSGADWKKPLGIVVKARWPEIVLDRFVLWRSYLGGEEGGAGGGPPGPRYVPLGEYGASG